MGEGLRDEGRLWSVVGGRWSVGEGNRFQLGFQRRLATIGVHSRLVEFRRDGGIPPSGLRFSPPLVTRHSSLFGWRGAGKTWGNGENRPLEPGFPAQLFRNRQMDASIRRRLENRIDHAHGISLQESRVKARAGGRGRRPQRLGGRPESPCGIHAGLTRRNSRQIKFNGAAFDGYA